MHVTDKRENAEDSYSLKIGDELCFDSNNKSMPAEVYQVLQAFDFKEQYLRSGVEVKRAEEGVFSFEEQALLCHYLITHGFIAPTAQART